MGDYLYNLVVVDAGRGMSDSHLMGGYLYNLVVVDVGTEECLTVT